MTRETQDILVCTDCYMEYEIGECDNPDPTWSLGAFEHGLAMYDLAGVDVVSGDSERESEFSWRRCALCGSALGGSRHQLIGIDRE